MNNTRVVVTGLGTVTPLGNDIPSFWENIINGKSGASKITKFDPANFKTQFACEVKDFDPTIHLTKNEIKRNDLYTQYALYTASQALQDAQLPLEKMDPFDIGVIWGTGQGGMGTLEQEMKAFALNNQIPRFNPFLIPKFLANMASGMISLKWGLQGINYSTVSACAASNSAMMDAYHYIKLGKAKAILTGGSDAPITQASIGGFNALRALSTANDTPSKASKPFDTDRDGFVMGEGAGAIILEEYEHAKQRGAHIYAEIAGASMTADAYHMTASHPEGLGASKAMQLALKEANISPDQLDYLNAHATSTPKGDLSEAHAINNTFGQSKLKISATKSMTGHLLGAAGAIEGIITIMALQHNIIPPTINTQSIDPTIGQLNIVLKDAIEEPLKYAMSNTFGFGGHNAIVLFKKI